MSRSECERCGEPATTHWGDLRVCPDCFDYYDQVYDGPAEPDYDAVTLQEQYQRAADDKRRLG